MHRVPMLPRRGGGRAPRPEAAGVAMVDGEGGSAVTEGGRRGQAGQGRAGGRALGSWLQAGAPGSRSAQPRSLRPARRSPRVPQDAPRPRPHLLCRSIRGIFFFFLPERSNERPSFANMLESTAYLWAVINLSVSRVLMDLVQIDQNVYSRNGNIVFFFFSGGGGCFLRRVLWCLWPAGPPTGAGAESRGLTARHFFLGRLSSPIIVFRRDANRAPCFSGVTPPPTARTETVQQKPGKAPGAQAATVAARRAPGSRGGHAAPSAWVCDWVFESFLRRITSLRRQAGRLHTNRLKSVKCGIFKKTKVD